MLLRPLILSALLAMPGLAQAAQRTAFVSSFSRVRVQGPYEVTIVTGRSPGAVVSGDRAAIDTVEVRGEGETLTVRPVSTAMTQRAGTGPVQVMLSTPSLASVAVLGAPRVHVTRMKANRVDLSVSGTGAIAVDAIEAEQANATVLGAGTMMLAGKVARARLATSGPGTVDAAGLDAGDLVVQLDGNGETKASARYTAQVTNTGLGRVSVGGSPKCRVSAAGAGPVACGKLGAP